MLWPVFVQSKDQTTVSLPLKAWGTQVMWLFSFALALTVLLLSMGLTPNKQGHGTHTQLGLPPCGVYAFTGYPCPGCGLTTSFAALAHGDLWHALTSNPLGPFLFLCTLLWLPFSLYAIRKKISVLDGLHMIHADKIGLMVCMIGFGQWLLRLGALFLP